MKARVSSPFDADILYKTLYWTAVQYTNMWYSRQYFIANVWLLKKVDRVVEVRHWIRENNLFVQADDKFLPNLGFMLPNIYSLFILAKEWKRSDKCKTNLQKSSHTPWTLPMESCCKQEEDVPHFVEQRAVQISCCNCCRGCLKIIKQIFRVSRRGKRGTWH